jgi:hypothetical protein
MSVVDDYGRFECDPIILRSKCYPRRAHSLTVEEIESRLRETVQAELIVVYQVGRKRYLEIQDFGQRIRSESKYPPPPADSCAQMTADDSRCPPTRAQGRTYTNAESDAYANAKPETAVCANPASEIDRFAEFRQVAESLAVSGSEPDWTAARHEWRFLDFHQRLAAIKGYRDRDGTGDYALRARPDNYLKKRMWERAIRKDTRSEKAADEVPYPKLA